jgi:serine/threonine-protein kinase
LWVEAMVFARFPVTNRQYIAFLDELVATGREADALRFVPRERSGTTDEAGAMIYGRTSAGRFRLGTDADGDPWDPDWPVIQVDWHGARAYAAWWAERTQLPWRLPRELEWEKAARGADGRFFPWGDCHDPSWCCMEHSHPDRPLPAVVDSFAADVTPYGVRGMGGNVTDWCLDGFDPEGAPLVAPRLEETPEVGDPQAAFRSVRGGSWDTNVRSNRAAHRNRYGPHYRVSVCGFRLARSW